MSQKQAGEYFSELLSRDNVMIITHRNPDGDTLGTAFALKRVLENKGRHAFVVNSEEISNRLMFITDGEKTLPVCADYDCIVAVDTATTELMGEKFSIYADKVDYCIDHHITNSHYAAKTIIKPKASSSGEYLFDLLKAVKEPIDFYIAEKLYEAISFDTGCFKYSNVTPHTLRVAASLLTFGLNAEEINRRLFDIASFDQIKVEHEVLLNAERYRNNAVTLLVLTQKILNGIGKNIDVEGFSALSRRIEGTVIGISMREMPDGLIKVSLRSMDDRIDVAKIASHFGGGGHKRASGCSFTVPVEEAKKQLLKAVLEEWDSVFASKQA